ncbi:uncharacterized protein LOC115626236 isoform X2 [Scaptodrosophila lebanonensis]|uniref:Uncharacterized protein LOC115626236 isoform X2 n=1 Tax=Drosophila lebanonensis TaxID=7225 RepID=A0A6J2TLD7_DROLE|nr:uncharacterized protein LOC115626236 isoform X2 [Scaptodrosophila lebanonensis]
MPSLARDILTYYKVIVIDSCIIDMTYLFYGLCVIISLIGYIIGGCMRSVKHVLCASSTRDDYVPWSWKGPSHEHLRRITQYVHHPPPTVRGEVPEDLLIRLRVLADVQQLIHSRQEARLVHL